MKRKERRKLDKKFKFDYYTYYLIVYMSILFLITTILVAIIGGNK